VRERIWTLMQRLGGNDRMPGLYTGACNPFPKPIENDALSAK